MNISYMEILESATWVTKTSKDVSYMKNGMELHATAYNTLLQVVLQNPALLIIDVSV
jgi:hypothetical protein